MQRGGASDASSGFRRGGARQFVVGEYVCTGDVIGKGSFANVYGGYHRVRRIPVAIKVVDLDRLTQKNAQLRKHLDSEIRIMESLSNPFIVDLLHVEVDSATNELYMVLEYCAGGDLSKQLKKLNPKRLPEALARRLMQHLALGLRFLRQKNIVHRDLKPQNLLLSSRDIDKAVVKIADFGFARFIAPQDLAETLCGSPLYMAPEILRFQKYNDKADLWSVGTILFELLTGTQPYRAQTHVELLSLIETKEVVFPSSISVSPECIDLIMRLLQKDSTRRISWDAFFAHEWLALQDDAVENSTSAPAAEINSQQGSTELGTPSSQFDTSTSTESAVVRDDAIQSGDDRGAPSIAQQRARLVRQHVDSSAGNPVTKSSQTVSSPSSPSSSSSSSGLGSFSVVGAGSGGGDFVLVRGDSETTPSPKPVVRARPYDLPQVRAHPTRRTDTHHPSEPGEVSLLLSIETMIKRCLAIVELGDLKQELSRNAEALSLYVKSLHLMGEVIIFCRQNSPRLDTLLGRDNDDGRSMFVNSLATSPTSTHTALPSRVRKLTSLVDTKFHDTFQKARYWQQHLRANDTTPPAEQLMYEYALSVGREAGVDEVYGNVGKSEPLYRTGLLLLETLLADSITDDDAFVLEQHTRNFRLRLERVRDELDLQSPRSHTPR